MRNTNTARIAKVQALLVGALLCAGLLVPRSAHAETKTVANPEYAAALEELDRITAAYGALAEEQDVTLSQLEDVRKQISTNETKIEEVRQDVQDSRKKLSERQESLAKYVAADYKSGGVSLLSIIFSSSSYEDLFSRIHYHQIICADAASDIADINAAKAELETRQKKLEKLESNLKSEEENLESLYGEQLNQTEAMYEQQMAASELLSSLPAEIQMTIEDKTDELIPDANPVADEDAQDDSAATEDEQGANKDEGSSDQGDSSQTKTDEKGDATKPDSSQGSEAQTTQSDAQKSDGQAKDDSKKSDTSSKKETETPAAPKPPKPTSAGTQQAVLDSAYSTSGTEALNNGWGCAGWVYTVFRNSGVYDKKPTCAAWYYNNWCYSSDRSELQPGMVIAVSTWTGTAAGKRYGHVGIYIGNNTVRHLSAGAVREMSVSKWIKQYGTTVTPRWGWNGGKVLS